MALRQIETRQYKRTKRNGCRRWLAIASALACLISTPSPAQPYHWFWTEVPARIDQGSRIGAMRVISDARARGRRLFESEAQVRSVLRRWQSEIEAAARHARLSEALITAVVMVESGGNPGAVSPAGAQGLGQLLPATARRYGVRNVFNPAENLIGAAAYLSDLIDLFRGDLVLALAAYNAGEDAVARHQGVPPFAKTRAYVPKVLAAFQTVGKFCSTPPRAARRQCRLPQLLR